MKKLFLAAIAVGLMVGMTDCKKEDTTPKEIQDAQVIKNLEPGDTIQEVVGDEVDLTEQNGQVVADGQAEVTEQTVVNSQDQVETPPIDQNNIPVEQQ